MEGIIGPIIAGIIIGALARLALPGKQDTPWWLHLLVGIVGVYVGYWLAAALGVAETSGVDWLRWIISIAVAAVAIVVVDRMGVGSSTRV